MSDTSVATPMALDARSVSKTFFPPTYWFRRSRPNDPRIKHALSDVSLKVREGEMVGLLGPNGAGKTTLAKIISTLIHPTSGEVRLWGEDIRKDRYAARGMIGLVTCDERSFYWRLTGRQNLTFFGALYGVSKAQVATRSQELMETLGLAAAADVPYHTYSSGMKQKLAIARGLLSRPRLLIYDEPTRSLDPLSTQKIRRWILEQRRTFPEQTHLLATNQLAEAELLCDRVFIVNRGRLVAEGTVEEIRARWDVREVDAHVIEIRDTHYVPPGETDRDPGVLQLTAQGHSEGTTVRLLARRNSDALSALLGHIARVGAKVVHCSTERASFDEVFCSLIESDADTQSSTGSTSQ